VTTAAGAVQVRQPRINDKRADPATGERRRFSSAILPAWSRKSPRVAEVLPLLYLHGLSTSDFGPALEESLGSGAGLSAATIKFGRVRPLHDLAHPQVSSIALPARTSATARCRNSGGEGRGTMSSLSRRPSTHQPIG
jgi:hypothetical protein